MTVGGADPERRAWRRGGTLGGLLALTAVGLAGCGLGPQAVALRVSTVALTDSGYPSTAPIPQGQTGAIQVTLGNDSQQAASGVALRLAMPAGLRYVSTESIAENGGAVRTANVDPPGGSSNPVWGAWTIPPLVPGYPSSVQLTIAVAAQGSPGRYQLTPDVLTAASGTEQDGRPITLAVAPAPALALNLRVDPAIAAPGTVVTYHATVTNGGSGAASATTLSLTLPEGFVYQGTTTVGGTVASAGATMPIPNTTLPVWAGYEVPAAGPGGPGVLALTFQVQIPQRIAAGSYAATAALITAPGGTAGTLQSFQGLAPVTVSGG